MPVPHAQSVPVLELAGEGKGLIKGWGPGLRTYVYRHRHLILYDSHYMAYTPSESPGAFLGPPESTGVTQMVPGTTELEQYCILGPLHGTTSLVDQVFLGMSLSTTEHHLGAHLPYTKEVPQTYPGYTSVMVLSSFD